MSWGNKILIVFIIFVSTILFFVFVASKQQNDLLDQNYYQEEIAFQNKINASQNLNKVQSQNLISLEDKWINVNLDSSLMNHFQSGEINFLHYSNKNADKSFTLIPQENGRFQISREKFTVHGLYKLRISWKNNNLSYYKEEDVTL